MDSRTRWGTYYMGEFQDRLTVELTRFSGDITSVTVFGTTIVTVHTYEKAIELLDKRSRIHSSRPKLQMLHLAGWEDHVAFLPYGSQLRDCRRMLRSEINPLKMKNYYSMQETTARRFLRFLVTSPEQFYDRVEW